MTYLAIAEENTFTSHRVPPASSRIHPAPQAQIAEIAKRQRLAHGAHVAEILDSAVHAGWNGQTQQVRALRPKGREMLTISAIVDEAAEMHAMKMCAQDS